MNIRRKAAVSLVIVYSLALSPLLYAQSKLNLASMGSLGNVITVAKRNGDFSDPLDAMNSISNAGPNNPYLLLIGPGVYELDKTLTIKRYVSVVGSGRDATNLKGSISSSSLASSAVIKSVESDTRISDLSIENNGGSANTVGLYIESFSSNNRAVSVKNIKVKVANGNANYGIYIANSSPTLTDSTISVMSGGTNYGLYIDKSRRPLISKIDISLASSTFSQFGVYNVDATPILSQQKIQLSAAGLGQFGVFNNAESVTRISDSTITISGGSSTNFGIFNQAGTSSEITRLTANVSGGTTSTAVYNAAVDAHSRVHRSSLMGATSSIAANFGGGANETFVSNSKLLGSVTGTPVCSFSFNQNNDPLVGNCQ